MRAGLLLLGALFLPTSISVLYQRLPTPVRR